MTLNATVGELVTERASRARVFERFGIDYCCGGKLPLEEACRKKGVDEQAVLAALAEEALWPAASGRNWNEASLTEIAGHIESTHHAYLKRELPRLEYLTGRVAQRHGEARPELVKLHDVFMGFKAELEGHMMKEERVLFPLCRSLDGAKALPESHCGSVQNPVGVMIAEHEHAGNDLAEMRALTNGFQPPEGACNTYRAMLSGLAELEADMHQHVHLENHVMFPKAIATEAELARCGA
ncbi:MAG: iron-sulfur cluster repair di-iron protein [Phycisphaerae bacterium]